MHLEEHFGQPCGYPIKLPVFPRSLQPLAFPDLAVAQVPRAGNVVPSAIAASDFACLSIRFRYANELFFVPSLEVTVGDILYAKCALTNSVNDCGHRDRSRP